MDYDEYFYVNLCSTQCINYYGQNSSRSFANYYYPPIKLTGQYHVALCQINYAEEYKRLPLKHLSRPAVVAGAASTTKPSITSTTPSSYFFDQSASDKLVIEKLHKSELIVVKKPEDTSLSLASGFAAKFNLDNLKIVQFFDDSVNPTITIKLTGADYSLKLNPDFAKFLGFGLKYEFPAGDNTAEKELQTELFNALPDKIVNELILVKREEVEFASPEYDEDDIADYQEQVVEATVVALETAGVSASIDISSDGVLKVEFEDTEIPVRFRLPTAVNEHLNLASDYFFSSDIIIALERKETISKPVEPTEVEKERLKILQDTISHQILVCTNCIEPVRFGSKFRPILRSIPRGQSSGPFYNLDFHPLQFHKVVSQELTNIRIDLTDIRYHLIPETYFPTTVVLLFVKSRL